MDNNSKNLNIDEEEYELLLSNLVKGDNTLFKKLFMSYAQDCITFLKTQYSIDKDTAYDITLDAIIVMRQRMVDGKVSYGNLKYLFFQIAKHIYLKSLRKGGTSELDFDLPSEEDENKYSEDDLATLSTALDQLDENCRKIIISFYYNSMKLYDIADMMEKSHDAIRKQKVRCQNQLITIFNNLVNR